MLTFWIIGQSDVKVQHWGDRDPSGVEHETIIDQYSVEPNVQRPRVGQRGQIDVSMWQPHGSIKRDCDED